MRSDIGQSSYFFKKMFLNKLVDYTTLLHEGRVVGRRGIVIVIPALRMGCHDHIL
jgi:hypothetical protein